MGISVLLLCLGLVVPSEFANPAQMTPKAAVSHVKSGGLLSYFVVVPDCVTSLPKTISVFNWGESVNDAIIFDNGTYDFDILFATRKGINGSIYKSDTAVRITKGYVGPQNTQFIITDVNVEGSKQLNGGSMTCDQGVSLYGLSSPSEELSTYADLVSHLQTGYNVNYVLNWDMCSPKSTSGTWWSGRISGYRFLLGGGVEFTQVVNTAEVDFYVDAAVGQTGKVQVKLIRVFRLSDEATDVQTRSCVLGDSYRVYEAGSS